jgi:hypothetical protein
VIVEFAGARSVNVEVIVNGPDVIGKEAGANEPCGELIVSTAVGVVAYDPLIVIVYC